MYTPTHFAESDTAEVDRLCAAHPLATLVATTEQGLVANHIPVLRAGDHFIGHIAQANDLHRTYLPDTEVLAIFTAPDGYVSPNWYPSKAETHTVVPTWNYQAVHVHGRLEFLHGNGEKRRILNSMTTHFERLTNGSSGWRMGDAPAEYLRGMVDAIVAFRLHITRIEAKSKLSQNKAQPDIDAVSEQLDAGGNSSLARAMRR